MRSSRPPTPPPAPMRETPFGDLVLVERIAVGGMAEVFRAREPATAGAGRVIVVKRMLPHIAAEPGAARMFEAEARIGRLIGHPNVVQVLRYGEAEGQPYLGLELVPGVDLGRLHVWLVREGQRLPVEVAVFVATELLAGLEAVHGARDEHGSPLEIVHGDVSPSNVLLSVRGEVKLADFGVAQSRLRAIFPQAAAAGRARGKLAYLAPEQVRGEDTNRAADLFSAATVIAELLVGVQVFARPSDLSTLLAIRDAQLGTFEALATALPAGLAEVVRRALAREPAGRYESAAALARALAPWRADATAELAAVVQAASAAGSSLELEPDEVTMEPPLHSHWVRSSGRERGPWTFAQVVEGITTGRVGPDDEVRAEGGPYRRLADIPGLSTYLPRSRRSSTRLEAQTLDLARGALVDGLARSVAAKQSGVWVCTSGEHRKEVFLVHGVPAFVTSTVPSDLLGEFLVERGSLRRGELDMALAVLPRFDGRLGDTLSALGLMEPIELFRHIGEQVREKLLSLFLWDSGSARFSAGVEPPERGFPLDLDPWHILREGVDRRLARGLEQDTFSNRIMDDLVRTGNRAPAGAPAEIGAVLRLLARARPLYDVAEQLADPTERDVHRPYRAIRLALALDLVAWA